MTIHVIAEQDTLNGTSTAPASEISADGLITAELIAELAKTATLVPLIHPGYAHPNPATPRPRRWPISCAPGT